MARGVALLFLVACVNCMEMRETVERMVMVRTTGSDLQPAATGYIYKKDNDGPASVTKMGESEVMEHFSKMYEQPKSFAAPIPVAAGPFYVKENEDKHAALSSESKIIPVVENQEEKDDHIDGIADEDYSKIFGEYASDFGDYKSDFDEYLKSLGYTDDGINHEDANGKDYGTQGHHEHGDSEKKGYGSKHAYEKGGSGDYQSAKYESYAVSGEGGHKKKFDDADESGNHHAQEHGYKGGDHGFKSGDSKGKAVDGFYKLFDKDEYKKDHDFYDGDAIKGGFYKFDGGHTHHGSGAGGFDKGDAHDSGHYENEFGKSGFHDKQSGEERDAGHSGEEGGESSQHYQGDFGSQGEGGKHGSRSYGYEIKH
ncbi:uncharacterized protein LOC126379764 [Pectinophora gossypiella]|nr:uncharacterized protein LOC126379764 [Pectinophora gossypiella]